MDNNDDESLSALTPNHFSLSVYKENPSVNMNQTKTNENLKTTLSYKCCLCQKTRDNPILTCSTCVHKGQFCSSTHEKCSNKRRKIFTNMLNKNDYEEFQQYPTNESMHFQCSERMFLLKKFNSEKKILQSEYQIKYKSSIEIRQMSEQIQIRKIRLNFMNHSIQRLREQIEQKKQINIQTKQRIDDTRSRIKTESDLNKKLDQKTELNQIEKNREKIDELTKQHKKLTNIRRQRFYELITYLFPIQLVSANEDVHATILRDLLDAFNDINNKPVENQDQSNDTDYRYQIVNSFLASNGDYKIDNLVSIYNVDRKKSEPHRPENDSDSPQLSPSSETYEALSALSHACQLINAIAFYLHINLPFRLHQLEFNKDNLTIDCLRADIAKLNTNIISCCVSQGIAVDFTDVPYTLENLLKLLTCKNYLSRPKPVIYPEKYIDMIEKEINEISRTFSSDYWFDDDDNVEKNEKDILDNYEWESIPPFDYIPDNHSIYVDSDSSPSTSIQQHSSITTSSIDFFKKFWNF